MSSDPWIRCFFATLLLHLILPEIVRVVQRLLGKVTWKPTGIGAISLRSRRALIGRWPYRASLSLNVKRLISR